MTPTVKPLIWRHSHGTIHYGRIGDREVCQLHLDRPTNEWVLQWMLGSRWTAARFSSEQSARTEAQDQWTTFVTALLS